MSTLYGVFEAAASVLSEDGVKEYLSSYVMGGELIERVEQMKQYTGHRDQRWGPTSYAQHGDDFMLINLFEMLGIEKGLYLDIGAHDPTTLSNTRLLYERGWHGVNVEANPNLIEAFRRERPRDTTLNVGVGVQEGEATFYMYSDTSGRNTFSPAEVQSLESVMHVRNMVKLPLVTLKSIVDQHFEGIWPNILSVDIEGLDFDVLDTAPFRGDGAPWGPMVIVVETRRYDTARMSAMLHHRGYHRYCRMGENLFFIRESFKEKVY